MVRDDLPCQVSPQPLLFVEGDLHLPLNARQQSWSLLIQLAGPTVRIGPNELSFTDPAAWKDIYSSHPGLPNFPRDAIDSRFEPVEDTGKMHTDMLAADDENHARQRRILSHAFSVEAIKAQEKLTTEYVDLFISKIGEVAEANRGVVDLNCWFNYLTFDIIGEMAFGESFRCMATGKLPRKRHYAL